MVQEGYFTIFSLDINIVSCVALIYPAHIFRAGTPMYVPGSMQSLFT